jgi:nucleoside-diphosphate-sugar epimerase
MHESKSIFITGADGFTGKHLILKLSQIGFKIYGTKSAKKTYNNDGIFPLDILNKNELKNIIKKCNPDYIIHFAAISFVNDNDHNLIYNTNIIGTNNLFQAMDEIDLNPLKVILSSSANIYGNTDLNFIDEFVLPNPSNPYAVSKLGMEYVANIWKERFPIIITRPFNYTGLGQSSNFLIMKIVMHFQQKCNTIELGNIYVERDYSDVRRVTEAYSKLILSNKVNETYNICSEKSYSILDIFNLMENISNHSIEIKINTELKRTNEIFKLRGSCKKLLQDVGGLIDIPLKDTLEWIYRS